MTAKTDRKRRAQKRDAFMSRWTRTVTNQKPTEKLIRRFWKQKKREMRNAILTLPDNEEGGELPGDDV